MSESEESQPQNPQSRGKTVLMVIGVAVVTSLLTVWLVTAYLFPREFKPVELSQKEEQVLTAKIERLSPEKYSEDGASREINFSERELNALLANNTDLAQRVVIDLSDNLASGRLLVPVDPDFPILGGKTVKAAAGLELRYAEGKPVVVLKGVSLWGVPLPNAWLGGLKNVDLVKEYGDQGFWKAFAAGVENIAIKDGKLVVKLKE